VAYKNYVSTFLNRKNTISGVVYRDDPTLMAVELMNEPHTDNQYEQNQGKPPGLIVKAWIYEMAAFVKVGGGRAPLSAQKRGGGEARAHVGRRREGGGRVLGAGARSRRARPPLSLSRQSIDKNHLVSTGEEGYGSTGDQSGPWSQHQWIQSGWKG